MSKSNLTSVIGLILAAKFLATGEQVESLAGQVVEGMRADNTYLRVLLAHTQSRLRVIRKSKQPAQEREVAQHVLDEVHAELYSSVVKGVSSGEEIDMRERNRRATFARSAASTVRVFIKGGGNLRELDVSTATKAGLRKAVTPAAEEGASRAERTFLRARDVLIRGAQRLFARGDPAAARERVEAVVTQLQAMLAEHRPDAPTLVKERRPRGESRAELRAEK